MRILLSTGSRLEKLAKDLPYGCWCGGKRVADAEYPPLDLVSIATLLEEKGHATSIDGKGRFDMAIIPINPATQDHDSEYLKKIKRNNPHCRTIAFGAAATFQTKELLESGSIDFAVMGEPEHTIKELASGILEKKCRRIMGTAHKEKGRVVINPPAPPHDPDSLPLPNRRMLRYKTYWNPLVSKSKWTTMVTSRGCSGKCTFCLSPKFYGGRVMAKSTDRVLEELAAIKRQGYEEVFFRDETFTWNRARTREICKRLLEDELELSWIANAKAGTTDKKTLRLMRKAGCTVLKIGAESGNQAILDSIRKGITLKQTKKTFNDANEAGIRTHAHFMLGCPGETKGTVRETIEFAKDLGPATATFGILTPYPGTDIFESVKRAGKEASYEGEHTKAHCNETFTSLTKEDLEKALRAAYKEFYFRPSQILGRLARARTAHELRNLLKSGLAVAEFAGG